MRPYFYAIDHVFSVPEFSMVEDFAHVLAYEDMKAPFDGVTYKNIAAAPPSVVDSLAHVLTWMMGYRVIPRHACFRLSLEGSEPPQWAHSDWEVSQYGFFLFVNPGKGGTVLLEHKETGMRTHPQTEYELAILHRDQNDESKWDMVAMVDSTPNRGILLRSDLIHAAVPRRGYGQTVTDGRLILLCFFD